MTTISIVRFDPGGECVLQGPAADWRSLVSAHGRSRVPGVREAMATVRDQVGDDDGPRKMVLDAPTARIVAGLVAAEMA
jgi:hypothetical protein